MKTLITFPLILFFVSCGSIKKITTETTTVTTKTELEKDTTFIEKIQVIHDTTIKFLPDSTSLRLYLECDSNNNVILKEIQELKSGNKIKQEFKFKDGQLDVKNYINEDSIKVYWQSYYEKEYIERIHKTDSTSFINIKKEEIKKQSPFALIKWLAIAFVTGLIIGLTKKYWIKLIRGF